MIIICYYLQFVVHVRLINVLFRVLRYVRIASESGLVALRWMFSYYKLELIWHYGKLKRQLEGLIVNWELNSLCSFFLFFFFFCPKTTYRQVFCVWRFYMSKCINVSLSKLASSWAFSIYFLFLYEVKLTHWTSFMFLTNFLLLIL